MVLTKRGTVVLAFLFLGVAIIGFTLEVSVLVVLAGKMAPRVADLAS